MNPNPKHANETPFQSIGGSVNSSEKKCYTAEEAMAFMESRIRAMFKGNSGKVSESFRGK